MGNWVFPKKSVNAVHLKFGRFFNDIILNIMSQGTKKVVYISAVTGQYVPKPYAQTHPNTTVRMVVKKG